jgi:hypothetical protein
LLESLLADGFAGAAFCDPPLFAPSGGVSELDRPAGRGGAVVAELLSTSVSKISFPEVESDLAARGGALWKGTFVAASVVTLCTGGLSQWVQPVISKDRAMPI